MHKLTFYHATAVYRLIRLRSLSDIMSGCSKVLVKRWPQQKNNIKVITATVS